METNTSKPNTRQFTEESMHALRQLRAGDFVGPIMLTEAGPLTWPLPEAKTAEIVTLVATNEVAVSEGEAA